MTDTRRTFLKTAAAAAAPLAAAPAERYLLGCQTLPYRAFPLERALEGIARAGYRYVLPAAMHARKPAFSPARTASERAELRGRFKDAGLTPFMGFVMSGDVRKPDGAKAYRADLDLCAEFGIKTVVGTGPWYYARFPGVPFPQREWLRQVDDFYRAVEPMVRHAESLGITITLKPHTGITANAAACMQVVKRIVSSSFKICWDAGNVSFYEGIHPDPDLPDLAPDVKAVCIKDHKGLRADANFPVPGQGQIDHELMFKILFGAGFSGPIAVERVDGTDKADALTAEVLDERIAAARRFLVPVLDRTAGG